MTSPYGPDRDCYFMRQALKQAKQAALHDEVPVGAVVVNAAGFIVGRGYNRIEHNKTQAAHAEITAISRAGKNIGDWRLLDCWIYVTLEPCCMCMNLIMLSRCAGLVYGASSPCFGYQGLDKGPLFQLYKENTIMSIAGICADESAEMLRVFFRKQRVKKKEEL